MYPEVTNSKLGKDSAKAVRKFLQYADAITD